MNFRPRLIHLRPKHSSRTRLIISFFLGAFLAVACQSTKTADTDLTTQTLAKINFADWIIVSELESQALLYLEQEPLKLGSIGSAILEKDPLNLIGKLALSKFYSSLGTIETGTDFKESYEESIRIISESGNGSPEKPWVVSSNQVAELFLKDRGISRVGGRLPKQFATETWLDDLRSRGRKYPTAGVLFRSESSPQFGERLLIN